MRRLKILMISPQYRPLTGGYERAAERLSAGLAAKGHRVTVIAERRDRRWPASEEQCGVRVERLWCVYRPRLHIATAVLSLAAFLLRYGRRFDVWHIHQVGAHALVAIALSKLLRRRVIQKLTSSGPGGIQQAVGSGVFPKIGTFLLHRVDAIAALTRETRNEALAFGMAVERVTVLGNGVDAQLYRPRGQAERGQLQEKAWYRCR